MLYVGVLSTDIILTTEGPKVLTYQAHFNNAAAQTLLPLLTQETNLADIFQACIQGRLKDIVYNCDWEQDKTAVMVTIWTYRLDKPRLLKRQDVPRSSGRFSNLHALQFCADYVTSTRASCLLRGWCERCRATQETQVPEVHWLGLFGRTNDGSLRGRQFA